MAQFDILIGCESFKEIREHHVYVDKTSIIEEMLTGSRSKVSLITRPPSVRQNTDDEYASCFF